MTGIRIDEIGWFDSACDEKGLNNEFRSTFMLFEGKLKGCKD
jgi:hypothetical protein